jgi:GntR family transcriptional regulator, transcriptional repressor for pyruvate dehydrogenase complex
MTDAQAEMTDLIAYIAHPAEVLGHSNDQHARLLAAVRRHDSQTAVKLMDDHVLGTEHVLAGLLPG